MTVGHTKHHGRNVGLGIQYNSSEALSVSPQSSVSAAGPLIFCLLAAVSINNPAMLCNSVSIYIYIYGIDDGTQILFFSIIHVHGWSSCIFYHLHIYRSHLCKTHIYGERSRENLWKNLTSQGKCSVLIPW